LRERVAFGRPLAENEALRARLADDLTELEAARLLVYRATWLADQATPAGSRELARASSLAKLYATEAAQRIVDDALQMHGGQGVLVGGPMERLYREVRALRLYEGTSEIQRALIARSLFEGR
jgi:acyl-CoA dehydrogenase